MRLRHIQKEKEGLGNENKDDKNEKDETDEKDEKMRKMRKQGIKKIEKKAGKNAQQEYKTIVYVDEVAKSLFSQMRGLMFRISPVNILFIFESEDLHPIHSWFVPYKFDAVYVDSDSRVVEIFRDIKPFGSVLPTKPARYLIELVDTPHSLRVGDKVCVLLRNR